MNCRHFRNEIAELLDADAGAVEQGDLKTHLDACADCARYYDEMTRTLEALRPSRSVTASAHFKEKVMSRIATMESEVARPTGRRWFGLSLWRPLCAAGALAAVTAVFLMVLVLKSPTPIYALEQTVEANRAVKFIHIRVSPPVGGIVEAWAEFGNDGQMLRLRGDFPTTVDGPKVVVLGREKAEVWFKAKKSVVVVTMKNALTELSKQIPNLKTVADELLQARAAGSIQMEVKEPSAPGEPITLIVKKDIVPPRRDVYKVDPKTKLLLEIEKTMLQDRQYVSLGRIEFLDYNQPIAPEVFTTGAPTDAVRVDQTTQEVGLAKGAMSDEEITVKVAREFFEALIARDFAKAGRLYEGIPAANMQEKFGDQKFVRIVSIGQPTPEPNPGVGGLRVTCRIEIEKDGVKSTKTYAMGIRPVYGQPDRWTIHGGI